MSLEDPALQMNLGELAELPIFSKLTLPQLGAITSGGKVVTTSHRDNVFKAGQFATHFGVVLSGAYKLTRINHKNEETVVHFGACGDVLAAMIMNQQGAIYPVTATSMGASRYLQLPRETYVDEWLKHPELIIEIQKSISSRMSVLHENLAMQNAPLSTRIAIILMRLAALKSDSEVLQLPMPLTRKEIAESTGTRVESVIRVMSDWSKMGIIKTDENRIVILQPGKLLEYARNQTVTGF